MEISLLQEKISHLQFVIRSQHQNLRSVIQEVRLIQGVSLVDGLLTVRRLNQAACLDFTSSGIFLPADISFFIPGNMTLFSVPSSVGMPTPVVFSVKIFGKLCLTAL